MARLFTPSESKYYLMALDAGTGSIRAVIFDLEGNQKAVGQAEWRHLAVPDVPGSMEFDLNKNWQLACECMRQALHNAGIAPEYIAAVSACSMREGIVLYNNEGTPIWACANVDARAAREVSELKELHNNRKGRNYQVNGTGDVLIDVPKPWNDPMANNPLTTLNLLEHDDSHVGVQLVKAQTVIGSGGSLTLRDLQGDEVEADKTLHIAQNGTVVAEGDYGFRLTTAPGDGLYVNYGLKALNIHGGQKLTLAEHGGAYGATADMSAKIGGEGDLAINTVRQVSLSNGQNDYQGATYVQMGTLRTDADGALGNTRELNISNAAIVDLNGSTQTVETFTGQMGSTVLFKEGALTVNKGGISQGELTGGGNLNVTGGTLAIEGLNARYNALTSISPNAEVSLDNTQGLGRGNIANDGLLTLKNVTGELRNSISGKGIVSATARTDVELDGDNSRFVGQFNIDTGSALSVNEQKNLGDASVINNGLLTISTERSWAMTHSISGSGDVTKLGTGILTLNNDSAAYQGTTDIVGGEIAFGSDSAINMASQHINIHNSGVMSGNVTTAGDMNVMPGGALRVAKTTIGGNLENGGTVQMNSEGGKPGNVLTVNGNYTGNNGLMTFNATLGGDNSPTDKMNVKGDTQGNTRVRVDNIGGVGAQTVNGIELNGNR